MEYISRSNKLHIELDTIVRISIEIRKNARCFTENEAVSLFLFIPSIFRNKIPKRIGKKVKSSLSITNACRLTQKPSIPGCIVFYALYMEEARGPRYYYGVDTWVLCVLRCGTFKGNQQRDSSLDYNATGIRVTFIALRHNGVSHSTDRSDLWLQFRGH